MSIVPFHDPTLHLDSAGLLLGLESELSGPFLAGNMQRIGSTRKTYRCLQRLGASTASECPRLAVSCSLVDPFIPICLSVRSSIVDPV